jgi:hypothetical protein
MLAEILTKTVGYLRGWNVYEVAATRAPEKLNFSVGSLDCPALAAVTILVVKSARHTALLKVTLNLCRRGFSGRIRDYERQVDNTEQAD